MRPNERVIFQEALRFFKGNKIFVACHWATFVLPLHICKLVPAAAPYVMDPHPSAAVRTLIALFRLCTFTAMHYGIVFTYAERTPPTPAKLAGAVAGRWKRLALTFAVAFGAGEVYYSTATFLIRRAAAHTGMSTFSPIIHLLLIDIVLGGGFSAAGVFLDCVASVAYAVTLTQPTFGFPAYLHSLRLTATTPGASFGILQLVFLLRLMGWLLSILVDLLSISFGIFAISSATLRYSMFAGNFAVLVVLSGFVEIIMIAQSVFYFCCKALHNEYFMWAGLPVRIPIDLTDRVATVGNAQLTPQPAIDDLPV